MSVIDPSNPFLRVRLVNASCSQDSKAFTE